jgi:hypothetical protein
MSTMTIAKPRWDRGVVTNGGRLGTWIQALPLLAEHEVACRKTTDGVRNCDTQTKPETPQRRSSEALGMLGNV